MYPLSHTKRLFRAEKCASVSPWRVAMIAISGFVAQELVNGLNLIPADEARPYLTYLSTFPT